MPKASTGCPPQSGANGTDARQAAFKNGGKHRLGPDDVDTTASGGTDPLIQPFLVPVKKTQAPAILATLRHDAHDQEEPNGATVVTDVQGARDAQDHLGLLPFFNVLIAPNVLFTARIFPVVWIECLGPTERFANLGEVSYVLGVLTIEREESLVRTCTTVADPRHEEPVLGGQLHP